MATALSGHIDDRDGAPTKLEDFSQCVHTSLRTSQAFGLLWRKLRRARALSGLGAISHPDWRDADGCVIAAARPDNPAEPGHTFADHEHTLRTAAEAAGLTTCCRSWPSAAPGEGDQFLYYAGPAEVSDAANQSATAPGRQVLHISWSARSPARNERGEDERVGGRGSVTALSHRSHQLCGLPRTVRPDLA